MDQIGLGVISYLHYTVFLRGRQERRDIWCVRSFAVSAKFDIKEFFIEAYESFFGGYFLFIIRDGYTVDKAILETKNVKNTRKHGINGIYA